MEYFVVFSRAFEELRVKHEQLQLITPQFETPLPPLQPAVSNENLIGTLTVFIKALYLSFPPTQMPSSTPPDGTK